MTSPAHILFGEHWEREGCRYEDRAHAGAELADHLLHYAGRRPLILGVPRGGVPVAGPVAERLSAPLDVIVARKLGAPSHEELGIGAVTADGTRIVNEGLLRMLGVSPEYLEQVTRQERAEAARREQAFRAGLPPLDVRGRSVIVVDDGLATGATLRVCVLALRHAKARTVSIAVPVGSIEACQELGQEVDELICPWRPDPFFSVGTHYQRFDQTRDQEVTAILQRSRARWE